MTYTESLSSFSRCMAFRYKLSRRWSGGPTVAFIGLNPSTADQFKLDPTVTRCVHRADKLGFGRLVMLNLFAFRATNPKDMAKRHRDGLDVIGDGNDDAIRTEAAAADMVICAWGNLGTMAKRDRAVMQILKGVPLHCLGVSGAGHPKHPLYLPYSQEPVEFGGRS